MIKILLANGISRSRAVICTDLLMVVLADVPGDVAGVTVPVAAWVTAWIAAFRAAVLDVIWGVDRVVA